MKGFQALAIPICCGAGPEVLCLAATLHKVCHVSLGGNGRKGVSHFMKCVGAISVCFEKSSRRQVSVPGFEKKFEFDSL